MYSYSLKTAEKPFIKEYKGNEYMEPDSALHIICEYDDAVLQIKERDIPLISVQLKGETKQLKEFIKIKIYKEEGRYFAENTDLCLITGGDTPESAMNSFLDQFEYFYFDYIESSPDELDEHALKIKQVYHQII